jgi:negative regulator of sigma-B (phosphoserine phosphatase)
VHPGGLSEESSPVRVIAHLSMPKIGEEANGDRVIVREDASGQALVGVIDALGHGHGAEEVAMKAHELLSTTPLDDLSDLMERLHARLRGSRGAAATLCLLARGQIQACGVGNVEFRCQETDIPFLLSPGILGGRVQRFRVSSAKTVPDTRLVFYSDGLTGVSRIEDVRKLAPHEACQKLFHRHRRGEDDATVLIADLG